MTLSCLNRENYLLSIGIGVLVIGILSLIYIAMISSIYAVLVCLATAVMIIAPLLGLGIILYVVVLLVRYIIKCMGWFE